MMRCGQDNHRRRTLARQRSENHFSVTSISQQRQGKVLLNDISCVLAALCINVPYYIIIYII